jgi:hypothetical protein
MRVLCRRIFNPISRSPVRMKLTRQRYANRALEKINFRLDKAPAALHFFATAELVVENSIRDSSSHRNFFERKAVSSLSASYGFRRIVQGSSPDFYIFRQVTAPARYMLKTVNFSARLTF